MNADNFYRTRYGIAPERFVSLQRRRLQHLLSFRVGGLVVQLMWDAGVFA